MIRITILGSRYDIITIYRDIAISQYIAIFYPVNVKIKREIKNQVAVYVHQMMLRFRGQTESKLFASKQSIYY